MSSKPRSQSNLAALDAVLKDRQGEWWDSFYSNRGRPVPFFVGSPDEGLWKRVNCEMIPRGRALDLDSGCFPHMPPHRRSPYVELVVDALKPGGQFAMTCFRPEGGSGFSDDKVYERKTLGDGFGYTDTQLQKIWSDPLKIWELRQMEQPPEESNLFGLSFLWALLAQRET